MMLSSLMMTKVVMARAQPSEEKSDESRYVYQPLIGEEDANRWNEDTRESILKNYNQRDLGL